LFDKEKENNMIYY